MSGGMLKGRRSLYQNGRSLYESWGWLNGIRWWNKNGINLPRFTHFTQKIQNGYEKNAPSL